MCGPAPRFSAGIQGTVRVLLDPGAGPAHHADRQKITIPAVEPGRYCLPRSRMPFNSTDEVG